jgi:hypothetical protein
VTIVASHLHRKSVNPQLWRHNSLNDAFLLLGLSEFSHIICTASRPCALVRLNIVYALDARSFTKWTMTSLCESAVLISVANGKWLVKYWISVHRFLQALQDEKKIDSEQSGSTTIDCVIEKTVQAVHVCSDKLWKWGWIWKLWTILENELRVIDDEENLNDLKFEITSAIYKAKKQWIAKKKRLAL